MPAFLVAPGAVDGDRLVLEGDEAHHVRVRRYRVGDEIDVVDGAGWGYRVRVEGLEPRRVEARILARHPDQGESGVRLHLAAAVPKGSRFDVVVEKATEVGVASITPLLTGRGVARPSAEGRKLERWLRLARAAAKQCGRSRVPELSEPAELSVALERLAGPGVRLLTADTGPEAGTLAAAVGDGTEPLALFTGPEGGFEAGERDALRARGARSFTWGERILRAETAAVVLSALALDTAMRHREGSTHVP